MLCISPESRISLEQLAEHKWLLSSPPLNPGQGDDVSKFCMREFWRQHERVSNKHAVAITIDKGNGKFILQGSLGTGRTTESDYSEDAECSYRASNWEPMPISIPEDMKRVRMY